MLRRENKKKLKGRKPSIWMRRIYPRKAKKSKPPVEMGELFGNEAIIEQTIQNVTAASVSDSFPGIIKLLMCNILF